MRAVILLIATFLQAFASAAEDPAIAALFKAEGVEGTIVVASLKSGETFVANEKRAAQPFAPASTFKVLNTLIAVEEGIVRDKDHAFRWDGVSRDIPEWNRDQTLASAFKVSCVWCYQEIARKVGPAKYRDWIARTQFGTLPEKFDLTTFWLGDGLEVSALQQIAYLKKLARRELPFSARSYDVLQQIMLAEDTGTYRLYAKTGWAVRPKPPIGWYVGYVETKDDTWVFALNMVMRSAADVPLRAKLALAALRAKGILP